MTNYKRIYGFEPEADLNKTLLRISNGKMPNIAVVSTSDLNVPVLHNLKAFADESDCLSLISIKHLNHLGKHCYNCNEIRSNCYDLSDESSDGYSEFNEQLDMTLSEFDLIITVGERYDRNYYNNRMPVLEYEDMPVVHLIDCLLEEDFKGENLYEEKWEYDNTITIPKFFVEEVADIHSDLEFVDYEAFFNVLCAKLIISAIEEIKKTVRKSRNYDGRTFINLNFFEPTDKLIKEAYKQVNPMFVANLANIT